MRLSARRLGPVRRQEHRRRVELSPGDGKTSTPGKVELLPDGWRDCHRPRRPHSYSLVRRPPVLPTPGRPAEWNCAQGIRRRDPPDGGPLEPFVPMSPPNGSTAGSCTSADTEVSMSWHAATVAAAATTCAPCCGSQVGHGTSVHERAETTPARPATGESRAAQGRGRGPHRHAATPCSGGKRPAQMINDLSVGAAR